MTHVADHALPVAARLPVVEDEALYQLIKRTDINASDVEDLASTAVEVSVLWKSAILHVAHLSAGQRFSLSSVTPTLPSPTRRMAPGADSVASDDGWVTMHGPKIEHKRRKGEVNAAMACGGGKEQLDELESPVQPGVPVAMACGGGKEQLEDAEAEALTARH